MGAEDNEGAGLNPTHTPQMFFRAAWSLVLRKGRLGVRGIHSPEGTGKTWIHTPLPCQTPWLGTGVLSAVCPLTLSYPKTISYNITPWLWVTFLQEMELKGRADSSPLHPSFSRAWPSYLRPLRPCVLRWRVLAEPWTFPDPSGSASQKKEAQSRRDFSEIAEGPS